MLTVVQLLSRRPAPINIARKGAGRIIHRNFFKTDAAAFGSKPDNAFF